MELTDILPLYDQEMRIEIEYPGTTKEILPGSIVRFTRPAPGANRIIYSRLDAQTMDAAIQEQIDYLTALEQPFGWIVCSHDQPSNLGERLQAHGLVQIDETGSLMVLDLQQAPPSLLAPVTADVRPIYHEQIGDAIRVEEQVWGGNFSWMHNRMGPQLDIPGYLSMYCAYVDGQPACTGWTYFNPNTHFASLWGGSTIPEQRKNGLYTAVLAVRIQEAIRRGYRFVFSDATAMSRAVVEQHGFQVLTYSHEYELPEKA